MCPTSAPSKFTVAILPLGDISPWQIKLTVLVLEKEFEVNTLVLPPTKIPSQYFNAERGRYQARKLLNFLFPQLPVDAQRIMGIVEGKLENANNELCQGIAYSCNRVAVYCVPHLSMQQSDPVKNQIGQDALSYHLIVHEFGHTLGLAHCNQSDCAMNDTESNVVLCAHCRKWANRELKVTPGSAEERFSLAESLLLHSCFTQAIAVYREAISLAPREPLYHHRLGLAFYKAGQFYKAAQELGLAIKLSNDSRPNTHYNSGLSFLYNKLELAENSFAKAIAEAKDPKFTQRLVGQAYREILHDVERASRHYKEYLRLGGDDPNIVDWLISRGQLDKP